VVCQKVGKRQIPQDVAIVDKKGPLSECGPCIPDPTAGIEQTRFVKEIQPVPLVGRLLPEVGGTGLGKMMRVERQSAEPRSKHAIEGKGEERLVENGNKWLGKQIRKRGKTSPETRSQNEGYRSTHEQRA
jgi:hypothetical protein